MTKSTTYLLDLKLEDSPSGPIPDKYFELLRDYLQPDSTLTMESVARSLEDLLPENAPQSPEVFGFGETCIEVAEQIPYQHPSQLKFVGLLEYLANSPKLGRVHTSKSIPDQYNRYQLLGESLRETLNGPDPEEPHLYVNFHAFAANLFERHIWLTTPTWALWAQRDAHEGRTPSNDRHGVPNDIYVLAAAQWIIWGGQSFFKQLLSPPDVSSEDLRNWTPGPLYKGKAHFTLHRWHFWRDGYNAVASSGKEDEKGYGQECKNMAARAAAIMDALEKNMTF